MSDNICWRQDCYRQMLEAEKRYPLLDSKDGKVFQRLIHSIDYEDCLEIGCGTGRLSDFCHHYTGCDIDHIIENVAKIAHPENKYYGFDIENDDDVSWIKKYDLIILSAFIDVMQEPLKILDKVLENSRNLVILHRQEFTNSTTEITVNPSYGGKTYHSKINFYEFNQLIAKHGFVVREMKTIGYDNWEFGGHSIILQKVT